MYTSMYTIFEKTFLIFFAVFDSDTVLNTSAKLLYNLMNTKLVTKIMKNVCCGTFKNIWKTSKVMVTIFVLLFIKQCTDE